MRRKKESVRDFLRSWHLPEPVVKSWRAFCRYRNPIEKGIYWWHFSQFIRKRDLKKYGTCISCGKRIEDGHAGHFISASKCGRDLLFDPTNVNLECAGCNMWDKQKLGYERNLDIRYGAGTAQALKDRWWAYKTGGIVRDWTREEYTEKLGELGIVRKMDDIM